MRGQAYNPINILPGKINQCRIFVGHRKVYVVFFQDLLDIFQVTVGSGESNDAAEPVAPVPNAEAAFLQIFP